MTERVSARFLRKTLRNGDMMKIQLAERMNDFEEGIFQLLNDKKLERESAGGKVFNLSVGTPDFKPSPYVIDALTKAASIPENYKYSLADMPELLDAVRLRYEKRYGVKDLKREEITSVYGSQEGITHIAFPFCNQGDIVLVPNPGYPIFSIGPSLSGAQIVPYSLYEEDGFLPRLSEIPEDICKRAKMMIVSYPLNPVCAIAPRSFYEKLIVWAKENNIIIIHDNAYSDIIYDGHIGESFLSVDGAKEVGAEFYSLSKSFDLTGARIAFLVGNEEIVSAFRRFRSQIDYGIFTPIQYAAIAALTHDDFEVKDQCLQYQKRRDALCQGLRNIGWNVPDSQGSMFVWAPVPPQYPSSTDFVMELFDKTGVLCTPGESFGSLGDCYVRFALTMPVEKIQEAIESIRQSGIFG